MAAPRPLTVAVAMSGGVDSAVATALCLREGHRVVGIMLRLWSELGASGPNKCCTLRAVDDAASVAARLGVPFHVLDARDHFKGRVVDPFVEASGRGETPNPCVLCNRAIRFGYLLDQARAVGADALATGHYARVRPDGSGGVRLVRGVDRAKDQSYVLHALDQRQLRRALFPVGSYTKVAVRAIAEEIGLSVASREDSVDLCWVGDGGVPGFLARTLPAEHLVPGPIVDESGKELGRHAGLALYTIGQRRGLGIAAGAPRYVVGKDPVRNALVVGPESSLTIHTVLTRDWHWIAGSPPGPEPWRVEAQTRYRARPVAAVLTPRGAGGADQTSERGMVATFDAPQRAPTPGQALVAYDGDVCLGGGTIAAPGAK